jgi:TrmH family RNA methyltransferase
MQVVACSSEECSLWLKREKILIFTSEVQASEWYYNVDFTMPSALVMGSEADGLSPYWRDNADRRIKNPMKGVVDSLNVSVSAAILCFEAVRQRNSKEDFK